MAIKLNREDKTLELSFKNGTVLTIGIEEAKELISEFEDLKKENRSELDRFEKLYLDYIKTDIRDYAYELEDVKGIRFEVVWNGKTENIETEELILIENEEEDLEYHEITMAPIGMWLNFDKEQVANSEATNHEIRACLGEDLLEFIEKNPKFEFWFNDELVNIEDLLNKENTFYYEFGYCHES